MAQRWWTLAKQAMNGQVADLGHTLAWKRLPREAGTALVFEGSCRACGASVQIGEAWSSCRGVRDARHESCSGPGTAVLTEVEAERSAELMGEATGAYLQALAEAGITEVPAKVPFRNPLAPAGQCGLMSTDGHTCIRRLTKRGTHHRGEWSDPDVHVGSHPEAKFTAPFRNDALLYT